MIRRRWLTIPSLLALVVTPAVTVADPTHGTPWPVRPGISSLAFRHVIGPTRSDLLAQRVIDREWGPSDDSVYVVVDVPGWKSAPLAATLSMAIPGAGQLYVGRLTGLMFVTLEAAGWSGWWRYRSDGRRLRREAAALAGAPEDPASAWSFERWSTATQGDAGEINALYAADREAFYDAIVSDPRYLAGWQSDDTRARIGTLRSRSDLRLGRSRQFMTGLWINHVVAVMGALRAARLHNIPLTKGLGLRLGADIERRGPAVSLSLERKL